MTVLLNDRQAPLFNRTTDTLELGHLDTRSVLEILRTHADDDPERLLFFWNLFEGVPKFYRDAFEQDVLDADRETVLHKLFFSSSSPLRNEADNWFLRELRGRYGMVLQFLVFHPGCNNAAIEAHLAEVSGPGGGSPVGGHLKHLSERFRMIERRPPIFAKSKARSGRYYIRDNFLRAWLSALQKPVSVSAFRPLGLLVAQADERLMEVEGYAFEDLVAQISMRNEVAWDWAISPCRNASVAFGIDRRWRLIWWRFQRNSKQSNLALASGEPRSYTHPFRIW